MPRITRLHFAGIGHRDARFPALTLDLRGADGLPADSVIWAENGVGKSSLLTLFFSSYQTNRRQFLGARGVAKARELEDYVQERDLSFILTEWDITDDRGSASLLADEPRELLVVGQVLSWKGLDRGSGELRRRFFSFRPNRDVTFDALPVAGLAEPVKSYESFLDWLNARAKEQPKLQIVHETNQGDWRAHLEACHLDPELFAYQLRMNLDEGGVNELFNELKENKDFIRLFLELGLDSETPNKVRANLNEFLPQHRRLEAMRAQRDFNERLLVELKLFLDQLTLFREAEGHAQQAASEASVLLAHLLAAQTRATEEAKQLQQEAKELEQAERKIDSQRESIRRRLKFFTYRQAQLEVGEAQSALQSAEREVASARRGVQLVALAELLAELRDREGEARALEETICHEQQQARPEREALEGLGACYKKALAAQLGGAERRLTEVQQQRRALREKQEVLQQQRIAAEREQAAKSNELQSVESFFIDRDLQRDRLRQDAALEPKEEAGAALERWRTAVAQSAEAAARARAERDAALGESAWLAGQRRKLAADAAGTEARFQQLTARIADGGERETALATHPEMQAAIEAPRADLDLPATIDRLRQRVATLLNQLLRLNADMAEDERAEKHVERDGLFPSSRDVEAVVEHLKAQGVASAIPASHWLALNLTNAAGATALLGSDPARFHGVMFNALADQARAEAGVKSARAPHAPVQVSPTPEQMPVPSSAPPLVVPPCHAGAYNRDAAQIERQSLQMRLQSARTTTDTLRSQHKTAAELETNLSAWFEEFGGGKLATLREQKRGEEQSLATLRQREQTAAEQSAAKQTLAHELEAQERQHDQARQRAEASAAKVTAFVEQFETQLAAKRSEREALKRRLSSLEAELGGLADAARQLKDTEPTLEVQEQEARDAVRDLKKELAAIAYAATEEPEAVAEPLAELREHYIAEIQRFEGRFKNTAAQGQLSEKQNQIRGLKQKLDGDEFHAVKQAEAQELAEGGNLHTRRNEAEQRQTNAASARGAADFRLKQARESLKELGTPGELDKPLQGELVPETAADVRAIVASLEAESTRLEAEHQKTRDRQANTESALRSAQARGERLQAQAKRLEDLEVQPAESAELPSPPDDATAVARVDDLCRSFRAARAQTEQERSRLADRHSDIEKLTRSEDFPRDLSIPARSLFATLTLAELTQGTVAADRQQAVTDQTAILKAELAQMQQHRELIVGELLNEAEKAISLLGRAMRLSRMPDTMTGWEGEPFLRIHLAPPHSQDEKFMRLRAYVDDLLARGAVPDGVRLVFDAVLALVTERGMDASILKPETQRRRTRYPVREMSGWSEGERTTVAILLYCTLVKLRTQSRGHADRRAEVSALLLDNPIGKASKPEFLEMHRWIAGALGVQLIYATGINDPQALSVFPNRIRLAKNRIVPQTGELAVGVLGEETESVVTDIRIFDGTRENEP